MDAIFLIIILFVVFVGGGWIIGRGIGSLIALLFFDREETRSSYIDKSVHHHHHHHLHDNRSVYLDKETFKNLKK